MPKENSLNLLKETLLSPFPPKKTVTYLLQREKCAYPKRSGYQCPKLRYCISSERFGNRHKYRYQKSIATGTLSERGTCPRIAEQYPPQPCINIHDVSIYIHDISKSDGMYVTFDSLCW